MRWKVSHRFDSAGVELADRHYNRQTVGSPQFVPPGRCVVLLSECRRALWVTSWPLAEYTKHEWAGAWVNSLFRNEGAGLSSELILEAVAATRYVWPEVPDLGMITFVDPDEVESKNPGYCYQCAGFSKVGRTVKRGLIAYQLLPENMPDPDPAIGQTFDLFGAP